MDYFAFYLSIPAWMRIRLLMLSLIHIYARVIAEKDTGSTSSMLTPASAAHTKN